MIYLGRSSLALLSVAVCFATSDAGEPAGAARPALPVGFFGPADPSHLTGGEVWKGALLAVEEANRAGGIAGRRLRVVARWDENPWSGGPAKVIQMVYQDKVCAVVCSVDSAAAHLAEQVAAKAVVPVIDPISIDRSVNLANVPWTYSLMPDERVITDELVGAMRQWPWRDSFLVLNATDHDSRVLAAELLKRLSAQRLRPLRRWEFQLKVSDPDRLTADVARLKPKAVVLLAGVKDSVVLVRGLRRASPWIRIVGGPAMGRRSFLNAVGRDGEGLVCVLPAVMGAGRDAFALQYRRRWGDEPDYSACYAYDAMRMLLDAIAASGPQRMRIHHELRRLSPWQGVTGTIEWDKFGRNHGKAMVATIRNGRLVTLRARVPQLSGAK